MSRTTVLEILTFSKFWVFGNGSCILTNLGEGGEEHNGGLGENASATVDEECSCEEGGARW